MELMVLFAKVLGDYNWSRDWIRRAAALRSKLRLTATEPSAPHSSYFTLLFHYLASLVRENLIY